MTYSCFVFVMCCRCEGAGYSLIDIVLEISSFIESLLVTEKWIANCNVVSYA